MILPQLLWRFVHHRDDPEFYRMQALDAIGWIEEGGVRIGRNDLAERSTRLRKRRVIGHLHGAQINADAGRGISAKMPARKREDGQGERQIRGLAQLASQRARTGLGQLPRQRLRQR